MNAYLATELGTGHSLPCLPNPNLQHYRGTTFSAPVRRIIYTTDAIESLHSGVRKAIRNKGHFPNDDAATKPIWLALRNLTARWKNRPITWAEAKALFAIQFGERFRLDD